MQFLRIEYDLATGIIHDPQTHVLGTQTMVNQTSREQEFRFELDASKIHTGTWEYSHGFPIKATAAFETGIPMVLEGKISMIDVSHMEKTWKFDGHKHAFSSSKLWKASLPVNVAPGESVRVTTTIVRGHLEVPFTIVLRSKSTDLQLLPSEIRLALIK
ncbi:unnamed protein product [Peniophora sp. CBMAI 1063]|nr:unnamed protein product [Peniophora sp. CBMAI 1063]